MTESKPASWPDDLTPADLGLVVPAFTAQELTRLRPDADGRYAWDRWRLRALEAGLSDDLAWLGRNLMREAVQHAWPDELKVECGWEDEGQAMLELALRAPRKTEKRWQRLMDTDGLLGRWDEKTGTFKFFKNSRGW